MNDDRALREWLSRCARMVIAFSEWLFAFGKIKVNFRIAEIFDLIKDNSNRKALEDS